MTAYKSTIARAIIVDDSDTIRSTLNAFLISANIEVIKQLSTGQNLLPSLDKLTPDIVCLDYNLPDTNGLELLKTVMSAHPEVAVVMITGERDPVIQRAAAEAGAAGFISKPFSQDQVVKEITHIIQTRRILAGISNSSKDSTTETPAKHTALIADDSKSMRELLKAILANYRVDVIAEATNGIQAVELALQYKPDIVCLDIEMPAMNGMDALREIRRENPSIKVLMITGNAQRGIVIEAAKLGVVGFIAKPFDHNKVGDAITKAINSNSV